jgi:predicted nuclease of restriction endonuclease-like (RecB) superfamily
MAAAPKRGIMTRKRVEGSGLAETNTLAPIQSSAYSRLFLEISGLLDQARHSAARSVNALLAATYWEIGRRIVEFEQKGRTRAEYGERLLIRLSKDLTAKHGRGFSRANLQQMRLFYSGWEICQTPSGKFEAVVKCQTLSGKNKYGKWQTVSAESALLPASASTTIQPVFIPTDIFPLAWSQYVRLMTVENPQARAFYESESIRGGWSVRQLDRQISTQFYDRAVRSKRPTALIAQKELRLHDAISIEAEVRDPYLLEFLNLKDEYSENQLEEALIHHLEWFLLEMGAGFTFVARQKRIRIGNSWYRIDLLLYHRGLKCLIIIDLKTGSFTHADAGQMNLYLNYAKEHMMMPGEADPIGIILCSDKDDAVVKYATGGILTRVFASKYMTNLPDEEILRREILTTQRALRARWEENKSNA